MGDARVVDENVQLPVLAFGKLYSVLPLIVLGHVEMDVGRFATGLKYLRLDLAALFVENVADDDFGSFLGKEHGFKRSLSPGASAYQGYLALQSSHDSLLAAVYWLTCGCS